MNTNTPSVLILGARGRIGHAAACAFAQAGWAVHAQVRPGRAGQPPTDSRPGIRTLAIDVNDRNALRQAAAGSTVVVHALNPPYSPEAWRAQAPAMLEASIHVASDLQATLLLPGNVYNFGTHMPPLLHEDTPQHADTPLGAIRVAMEQRLADAARQGQVRSVVIRAGNFFGQGTGTWLDLVMARRLAQGHITLTGPRDVATAWAYLPDLAETFVRVAQRRHDCADFDTLNFGGHSLNGDDWVQGLSTLAQQRGWLATGQLAQVHQMPWTLLRLGGLLVPSWRAVHAMRYLCTTPHRLDNTKLRALLGTEPHTPLDRALEQTFATPPMRAAVAA